MAEIGQRARVTQSCVLLITLSGRDLASLSSPQTSKEVERDTMSEENLVKLAHDLEWLGCEAGFYSQKTSEAARESFLERQRAVLATADKLERELKGAVRFNLTPLVGIDYPIEWTFDSITSLLATLEMVKQSAVQAAHELPSKVRQFRRMINDYVTAPLPLSA
jgi:hypothetical protein